MASSDSALLGRNVSYDVTNMSVEQPGMLERMKNRADSFREYLSTTCCACLASVPSFALVILAVVLVMLLIASIPLAFAFTYKGTSTGAMEAPKTSVRVFRAHDTWVENTERLPDSKIFSTSSVLPPKIDGCKGFGFACTNEPSHVIGTYQRCDGVNDCLDGSDEMDCHRCQTTLSCAQKDHSQQKICLRGNLLCDGIQHCSNGADEKVYCQEKCPLGLRKCKDANICLSEEMICDGDNHCPDGDDEKNCSECQNGAKLCKPTSTCIPKWQLCDGKMDCPDNSDEYGCNCKTCSGNSKVLCKGEMPMCLLKSKVCDGKRDCPDGEDEERCPGTCELDVPAMNASVSSNASTAGDINVSKTVTCGDKVVNWRYGCGGFIKECDGSCKDCYLETSFDCKLGSDSSNSTKCIHRSKVCDGKDDCGNNADEQNCNCDVPGLKKCSSRNLAGSHNCYSEAQQCDGYNDCPDGEDEKGCRVCKKGAFLCVKEKKCVASMKRCDGVDDCSDQSDEMNCNCTACKSHPFETYMCSSGSRCYRANNVCTPYSQCPDADDRDNLHCAMSHGGGRSYL